MRKWLKAEREKRHITQAQMAKELGLCVLDAGHYGSEKIFVENMADMVRLECRGHEIEVMESAVDINPFK